MARKGKKRSITVFGCTLEDGTQILNTADDITSIIVNPDRTVTSTNMHNEKTTILDDNGNPVLWVSYVPRAN